MNAVCPGITDTPMQDAVLEDVSRIRGTTPDALAASRTQRRPARTHLFARRVRGR